MLPYWRLISLARVKWFQPLPIGVAVVAALSWEDFFPETPLGIRDCPLPVAVAATFLVQLCDPQTAGALSATSSRSHTSVALATKIVDRRELLAKQAMIQLREATSFKTLAEVLSAPGGLDGWKVVATVVAPTQPFLQRTLSASTLPESPGLPVP